ncbi:MAG: polysaccharide biosynthesis/export family protein [Methylocella sp.]
MPRVLLLVIARILLAGAACLAFAGCSSLSGIGPSAGDVVEEAGPGAAPRYELVDIDSNVVETLRQRGPNSFLAHFGDYRPSVEPRIGIGDTVMVTIWEAGAGGLFSAPLADHFSTGSKSATIPDQVVGRDGAITVPYAGRIPVAGRTTRDVQTIVEHALQGKAIQPQVLVNVVHSVSNNVTVTGEVVNGARVSLSVKGDRVMEVIAAAGGIRAPVNETYVQLSRGDVTERVAMTRVSSDPKENIYMRANDFLTLIRDPQTFIAYGAMGRIAEIPFDAEGINLSQALAKAGGLLDAQSDPAGVFVFRYEPEAVARALRPDSPLIQHGYSTPVVYRLNLREANSLFVAQNFHILNRDLLYVSNASIDNLRKVMEIVGLLSQPAYMGVVSSVYLK